MGDNEGSGALLILVVIVVGFILSILFVFWLWGAMVDIYADRVYGNDQNEFTIKQYEVQHKQ